MNDRCDVCYTSVENPVVIEPENDTPLCDTCARFIRLAKIRGHKGWRETFRRMEQAMIAGARGFLEPAGWIPEEVSALDKFYTMSEERSRSYWASLSRSFRDIPTSATKQGKEEQ